MLAVGAQISARDNTFTYDYAFPENVEQVEVYAKSVSPMMDKLFDGYHQTVFAYGQTGSGKTFTMGGEYKPQPGKECDDAVDEHVGIIPRVAQAIMAKAIELEKEHEVACSVSYFELYKEDIRDLLRKSITTLVLLKYTPINNWVSFRRGQRILLNLTVRFKPSCFRSRDAHKNATS